MIQILFAFLFLWLPLIVFSQQTEKVIIDGSADYLVKKENETYQSCYVHTTFNTNIIDTVKANLVVNYDPNLDDNEQIVINSTDAKLLGDTLELVIFHNGYQFIWEYKILIIKDSYLIKTWFVPPTVYQRINLEPISTYLMLNTSIFRRGAIIKGHTRMKAKCRQTQVCFNDIIIIEGSFIAMIK